MLQSFYSSLNSGLQKIRENPQLIFSAFVALVIVASFVFMANRFIAIANDAEERLINVRVGSIQDAFAVFASDNIHDSEYLNAKISEIIRSNETIRSFRVLSKENVESGDYIIRASNDPGEIGMADSEDATLFALASSDPASSMTIEANIGEERIFNTVRAITDQNMNTIGVVLTTQTLSEADRIIQRNIINSIYLLVIVIILILILFVRHSKIIDYMGLYKRLKEVDQLKDDFISMASHELRTPLSVIRGYAEYIREAADLSLETKDYASKIDVSAKSLDSLVSDILDVSKIQQGRMSYRLAKINPCALLEAVINSLQASAREKSLELSFDKSRIADDQTINADEDRLRQVLINIIGNAVKYTEKGSVNVSQYSEDGRLFIRVSDTGIGLCAEERERLFEKFYRVKNKETQEIRGTGLGLWITSQMVKEMNGKITVESIKSVGSHFVISFPMVK